MSKSSALVGLLVGFGTGAAAMYFFDPDRGARRRSIVSDKAKSSVRHFSRAATNMRHDLANRSIGLWARTRHFLNPEDASDPVIEQRVRSKMGRIVSHPHAIKVTSTVGKVSLSGMVLADELPGLLRCVRSVPGVRSVENGLKDHVALQTDRQAPSYKEKGSAAQAFIPVRPQAIH